MEFSTHSFKYPPDPFLKFHLKEYFKCWQSFVKILNDTKEIISTPAMKLSLDPDAWDLEFSSSSPPLRHSVQRPSPFSLGILLLRGAVISGKDWDCRILKEKFE